MRISAEAEGGHADDRCHEENCGKSCINCPNATKIIRKLLYSEHGWVSVAGTSKILTPRFADESNSTDPRTNWNFGDLGLRRGHITRRFATDFESEIAAGVAKVTAGKEKEGD